VEALSFAYVYIRNRKGRRVEKEAMSLPMNQCVACLLVCLVCIYVIPIPKKKKNQTLIIENMKTRMA